MTRGLIFLYCGFQKYNVATKMILKTNYHRHRRCDYYYYYYHHHHHHHHHHYAFQPTATLDMATLVVYEAADKAVRIFLLMLVIVM